MTEVYAKGIQVYCHANGDAAIDMIIEGAQLAGVKAADDRRTVIVHSQCMRPDQIAPYVELGFSPSYFTMHTFFWGSEHVANLGEALLQLVGKRWTLTADRPWGDQQPETQVVLIGLPGSIDDQRFKTALTGLHL